MIDNAWGKYEYFQIAANTLNKRIYVYNNQVVDQKLELFIPAGGQDKTTEVLRILFAGAYRSGHY